MEFSIGLLVVASILMSSRGYPKPLRRIRFKDPETGKTLWK